ncbi:hypothetical protein [Lysinibacillus sp. LZ02]|uniref:hypothetical protein n=1 Tax=Lysinibacillus sp. LZ02 TaxID=3420668 RepID=UPI003D36F371
MVLEVLDEELAKIKEAVGEQADESRRYAEATALFKPLIEQDDFVAFLTLPGYEKD